jgi:signal transduction histidine kinase
MGGERLRHAALVVVLGCVVLGCGWTTGAIDLSGETRYLVDESGEITADRISEHLPSFERPATNPPEFPYSRAPYWFRVELARSRLSERAVLVVDTEKLASIEMFIAGRDVQKAGNAVALRERVLNHRNNVFVVDFREAERLEAFFRVRAKSKILFPLRAWPADTFFELAWVDYLALGLFFGAALIMAGYNAFLAVALKRAAYLYYSLYTLSLALYVAYDERLLLQLLLRDGYTPFTSSFVYSLLPLTGILYFRSFLEIPEFSRRLDAVLRFQIVASAAAMFSGLWIEGRASSLLVNANIVLALTSWLISIIVALRNDFRPARYMALALATTVVLGFVTALEVLGASGHFDRREHGVMIATVLDLLILSLGLADSYRELQREHYEEKSRFIREVHDTIGSQINAAIASLPRDGNAELRGLLSHALENARDFTALINSSQHPERSFEEDVRAYVRNLDAHGQCEVTCSFDPRLNAISTQQRVQLYRIFQEWMGNALRHAKPSRFKIEFVARGRRLILRIQNDGTAFSWRSDAEREGAGSGLRNIRFRCEKIAARARAIGHAGDRTSFVLMAEL